MTKKEILEIRKQFTITNCTLTKICGCYVDDEKQMSLQFDNTFLGLPEELEFKYLDIFQKALSGKLNRNLLSVVYHTEEEKPDSAHSLLMDLRKSRLSDESLLSEFYESIVESYEYAGKYLILLVHGVYDVPGKSTDGTDIEDASEEVYEHILCTICPVDLSDAGLCVNLEDTSVEARIRDWIVKMPMHGFLFPAFNNRETDIHGALFYTKKENDLQEEFIRGVLGCQDITSGTAQKDFFKEALTNALCNTNGYQVLSDIQDTMRRKIEEAEGEVPSLSKKECLNIFSEAGMNETSLDNVSAAYDQVLGEKGSVLADSLTDTAKTNIEAGSIKVTIPDMSKQQVEILEIEGRKCIAIYPEGPVTVNGVETHI